MLSLRRSILAFVAVFSAVGSQACADGPTEETAGAVGSSSSSSGSSSSSSTGAGGAGGCGALKNAIAEETAGNGTCTATVRFRYQNFEPLGFQILCHPYVTTDIKTAFATAISDTKLELTDSLTEKAPKDDFVFYRAPIDFGGAAVVSARSGLTVFGGSIVWDGQGGIDYPSTFRPAADLGPGCASKHVAVTGRGFSLESKMALDEDSVAKALAALDKTMLPEAMARESYLFDAMVLLYPRAVGLFDPTTAEWVVVLNTGYLE